MTEFYVRPDGMPPGNGYSHAVAFTGRTVIISGQLPLDRDGKLAGTEAETQMRQVFQNLSVALAAAGTGMAQVVKLTVYLTDFADLPAFRQVRDEYVSAGRPPASSLVRVAGLVHPEARVEIEALAITLPAWPLSCLPRADCWRRHPQAVLERNDGSLSSTGWRAGRVRGLRVFRGC